MDQLPRLGKRELICLLSFTCNYVVFVWRGFLFLWVLGMGYVILLWHSLSLPYNYYTPIYAFLTGGAGFGKSVVIRALYQSLYRILNLRDGENPDDIRILLCAYIWALLLSI